MTGDGVVDVVEVGMLAVREGRCCRTGGNAGLVRSLGTIEGLTGANSGDGYGVSRWGGTKADGLIRADVSESSLPL